MNLLSVPEFWPIHCPLGVTLCPNSALLERLSIGPSLRFAPPSVSLCSLCVSGSFRPIPSSFGSRFASLAALLG